MDMAARGLIGLIAAFFLINGLGFWFNQEAQNAMFALATANDLGKASIRADFGGFFLAVGIMSAMAAWKRCRWSAAGAALLLGLALVGRGVSLAMDGAVPGFAPPMIVEAVCVAILLWARKLWNPA
jgi:hypothetical protein